MTSRAQKRLPILCVDDDEPLRTALVQSLCSYGYEVIEADSAEMAQAIIRESSTPFAALISDFNMEGQSGAELIRTVDRSYPRFHSYVLMTGLAADHSEIQELLSAPTRAPVLFLAKPFHAEDLLRLLERQEEKARQAGLSRTARGSHER